MNFLKSICVAFSLYSVLPVPKVQWTRENLQGALLAFPLVGAVCGLVFAFLAHLPGSPLLRGAFLCLAPVVLTGGIHLDGYADTWDARACWGDPEKKREILKDPHCGAFAVIHLGIFFVASFGFCAALDPTPTALWLLGFGFVLSRAFAAWSIAGLPLAQDSGLAYTFASNTDRGRTQLLAKLLGIGMIIAQIRVDQGVGTFLGLVDIFCLWRYRRMILKEFGGVSGDLAGWFVQTSELWQLGTVVFLQAMVGRP